MKTDITVYNAEKAGDVLKTIKRVFTIVENKINTEEMTHMIDVISVFEGIKKQVDVLERRQNGTY